MADLNYMLFREKLRFAIAMLMVFCLLSGCPGHAHSESGSIVEETEKMAESLMATAIKIVKVNTELLDTEEPVSKFTKKRVAFYNTAASSAIGAGLVSVAAARWSTLKEPERASQAAIEAGPILIIAGNSLVLAGLISEMVIDKVKSFKNRRSKNTYSARLKELKSLFNQLAREEKKIQNLRLKAGKLSPADEKILERVNLKYIQLRRLCVQDSIQILKQIQYKRAAKRATLGGEVVSSSTGAFGGGLMALIAVSEEKAKVAGPAGIGFIVSGATLIVTPALSRLIGKISANRVCKKLRKRFLNESGEIAELQKSQGEDSVSSTTLTRLELAVENVKLITDDTSRRLKAVESSQAKTAAKKTVLGSLVGGTKLAGGIQLTSASYSFDPGKMNAGRVFSTKVAAGDTTYIPGASTWLANSVLARKDPEGQIYTFGKQRSYLKEVFRQREHQINDLLDALDNPGTAGGGGS